MMNVVWLIWHAVFELLKRIEQLGLEGYQVEGTHLEEGTAS